MTAAWAFFRERLVEAGGAFLPFLETPLGVGIIALATLVGAAAVLLGWGRTILAKVSGAMRWLWRRIVGPPRLGTFGLPTGRKVIGRERDVAEVRRLLSTGRDVALTNSGAVLHGQGGIGKSTLARRYVERYEGSYHAVLWTKAETRQALVDGLCSLCGSLGLPIPDIPGEAHAVGVLAAVRGSEQPWLFVYDNVETRADIEGLTPQGAHLILTTRRGGDWPGFTVRPTDTLDTTRSDGPATRLLMETAGRSDDGEGARALVEALDGLPLGLVVMGSMIRQHGGSWADWQGRLAEALDHTPASGDYPTSILGAVRLSYDRLPPDARLIADLCAWWAPDGLGPELVTAAPEGWLWQGKDVREAIPPEVDALAQEAARVRAGFDALAGASLITGTGEQCTMHRMTAAALRAIQGDAPLAAAAAALLAAVYPYDAGANANWPTCKRLSPHVRALLASGRAPRIAAMDYLCNQASIYLDKIGDHAAQVETARVGLAIKRARLLEDHRDIAVGLANLGSALGRAGKLPVGEVMLAEAVRLSEAYRPGSADLATQYDLHGGRLFDLAQAGDATRLDRALRRFQQALAMHRRLSGRASHQVAVALNNLGAARRAQGRGAAAARLAKAALSIFRQVLAPDDVRLAVGAMNTGSMWLEAGAADRAEALLREALEIRETVLADHPGHPERRNAAGGLIVCLLTRARAGENRRRREAEACSLCTRYGFDFEERQARARRIPYTPGV